MGEGMTEAQLIALTQQTTGLAYLFVGLAGLFLFLAHVGPDGLRRWERLRDHFFTVKSSMGPAADYVEGEDDDPPPNRATSATSRQEVEAEARREVRPEGSAGIVTLTEKALQVRENEAYERGMIAAFAAFQSRGYIPRGKATELKQALFAVSGGRQLQTLNAALDAVDVPAEPAPQPEPARVKPVTGAPVPGGTTYSGEQRNLEPAATP